MVIALGDLFALESIHFRIKGGIKTLASAAKQSQSSSIPEREQRLWSPVEPSYCFPTGQNSPVLAPVICPAFLFLFSPTFLYFSKISVLVTVGEICKSRELPYLIQGIRCSLTSPDLRGSYMNHLQSSIRAPFFLIPTIPRTCLILFSFPFWGVGAGTCAGRQKTTSLTVEYLRNHLLCFASRTSHWDLELAE